MAWTFIFLSLAALAYTLYLIMEHMREVSLVDDQILRNREMASGLEVQIEVCERERDEAKVRVAEAERTVKEMQSVTDELQSQISERKREMERRGKFRVG